jgi:hypothetical protein
VDWGDYDRDGDLDIVESGRDHYDQPQAAIFRVRGSAEPCRALPRSPSVIQGDRVILDWSAAPTWRRPRHASPTTSGSGHRRAVPRSCRDGAGYWPSRSWPSKHTGTHPLGDRRAGGAILGCGSRRCVAGSAATERTISRSRRGCGYRCGDQIASIVPNPSARHGDHRRAGTTTHAG